MSDSRAFNLVINHVRSAQKAAMVASVTLFPSRLSSLCTATIPNIMDSKAKEKDLDLKMKTIMCEWSMWAVVKVAKA